MIAVAAYCPYPFARRLRLQGRSALLDRTAIKLMAAISAQLVAILLGSRSFCPIPLISNYPAVSRPRGAGLGPVSADIGFQKGAPCGPLAGPRN
jgi:hypothetical protein